MKLLHHTTLALGLAIFHSHLLDIVYSEPSIEILISTKADCSSFRVSSLAGRRNGSFVVNPTDIKVEFDVTECDRCEHALSISCDDPMKNYIIKLDAVVKWYTVSLKNTSLYDTIPICYLFSYDIVIDPKMTELCRLFVEIVDEETAGNELSSQRENEAVLIYAFGTNVSVHFNITMEGGPDNNMYSALNGVISELDDYLMVDFDFEIYEKNFTLNIFVENENFAQSDSVFVQTSDALQLIEVLSMTTDNMIIQLHTNEEDFQSYLEKFSLNESVCLVKTVYEDRTSELVRVYKNTFNGSDTFQNVFTLNATANFKINDDALCFQVTCARSKKVGYSDYGAMLRDKQNKIISDNDYMANGTDVYVIAGKWIREYPSDFTIAINGLVSTLEIPFTLFFTAPSASIVLRQRKGSIDILSLTLHLATFNFSISIFPIVEDVYSIGDIGGDANYIIFWKIVGGYGIKLNLTDEENRGFYSTDVFQTADDLIMGTMIDLPSDNLGETTTIVRATNFLGDSYFKYTIYQDFGVKLKDMLNEIKSDNDFMANGTDVQVVFGDFIKLDPSSFNIVINGLVSILKSPFKLLFTTSSTSIVLRQINESTDMLSLTLHLATVPNSVFPIVEDIYSNEDIDGNYTCSIFWKIVGGYGIKLKLADKQNREIYSTDIFKAIDVLIMGSTINLTSVNLGETTTIVRATNFLGDSYFNYTIYQEELFTPTYQDYGFVIKDMLNQTISNDSFLINGSDIYVELGPGIDARLSSFYIVVNGMASFITSPFKLFLSSSSNSISIVRIGDSVDLLSITIHMASLPTLIVPVIENINYTADVDGYVNCIIFWKIVGGYGITVSLEEEIVGQFYTTDVFKKIDTLYMGTIINSSSLNLGTSIMSVIASNVAGESTFNFTVYQEDLLILTTTTTTTPTTTPATTTTPQSPLTTLIQLTLGYCQLNTQYCAFTIKMNVSEYQKCNFLDGSGVELLTLDCKLQTFDCSEGIEYTLNVDFSSVYKEDSTSSFMVSMNCIDFTYLNHSLGIVEIDFVRLHMNTYLDPSTQVWFGGTRLNFNTLVDLKSSYASVTEYDITGLHGAPVVVELTCHYPGNYCEFDNPKFVSPNSRQWLCILMEFNTTYLDLCKYLLQPAVLVTSTKKLYIKGTLLDSLFPVALKLDFKPPVELDEYNATWETLTSTLYGNPVQQFFNPGHFTLKISLQSNSSFLATHSVSLLLKPGINVSMDFQTKQMINQSSTFHIKITEYGSQPCFLINFDDGSPALGIKIGSMTVQDISYCESASRIKHITWQPISSFIVNSTNNNDLIVTHFYTVEKTYQVKFMAFNSYNHNQTLQLPVYVSSLNCNAPTVTLIGTSSNELLPSEYYASKKIVIESIMQTNCKNKSLFQTSWKILVGPAYDKNVTSKNVILTGTTELMIPGNLLPYGMARICMKAVMIVNYNIFTEVCEFIRIISSPLIAFIEGGNEIIRSTDVDYHIVATSSMDPDTKSLVGVEIFYLCRSIDDKPFSITYQNIINLQMVYPRSLGTSIGGCYGNGVGKLEPSEKTGTKVVLQSAFVVTNKKLEITLYLRKKSNDFPFPRVAIFTQVVTFIPAPVPILALKCLDNCGQYINYNDQHSIEAVCSSNCLPEPHYKWYLYECTDSKANTCAEVNNNELDGIITMDRQSRYFAARKQSYKVSTWYKVQLRAERNHLRGEASIVFFVNRPPIGGTCRTNIDSGIVLNELFTLSCSGWTDEDLPLKYTFFTVTQGVKKILYNGQMTQFTVSLPQGNENRNDELELFFSITDQLGSSTVTNKTVQVHPPSDVFEIMKNITSSLASNDSLLKIYTESGDLRGAANTLLVYSTVLKNASNRLTKVNSSNDLERKVELLELRSTFVKSMQSFVNETNHIPVELQLLQITRITGALSSITEYPTELDDDSRTMVMDTVRSFTGILENSAHNIDDLASAAAGVASLLGDISEISASLVDVNKRANDSSNYAILRTTKNESRLHKQSKERVKETDSIIRSLENVLSKKIVPGGENLVVSTPKLNLAVGKVLSNALYAKISAGKVAAKINMSRYSHHEYLGTMLTNFVFNLYTTDASAQNIKSELTGLQLTTEDGDLEVTDAEDPIVITIANKPVQKLLSENRSMNVDTSGEQWSFQSFVMANKSFRAVIDIKNDTIGVDVYIRKAKRPTVDKYDYKFVLPDNSSCEWKDLLLHNYEPIDLLTVDMTEITCKHDPNVIFLSDIEELDGEYFLGIHYVPTSAEETNSPPHQSNRRRRNTEVYVENVDKDLCVVILPPPPTPAPTDPPGSWEISPPVITNDSVKYSIDILKSKCLFWNQTTETWSSNGCYVGPNTTPERTECLCNHLTDFGGDVLVAPAPIDFDKVFAGLKNLGDNLGVLMVILTIILVYILFIVWARKKDRKDKEQSIPVVIDFSKGSKDAHSYLVTIVTGAGFGAGTTANVYCKLSGSLGDSILIPLKAIDDRKVFQARTTTTFKIILSQSVGDLDYIRIFHDNSGRSPSWYLRNMIITDNTTKKQYPFVCNSWLAVESDDGQIEKLLPIANDEDLAGFHIVFAATAAKGLLDGHIWFSVVTRPHFSTFTRVQRASCCLSLIYLTMVTNAMFFGVGDAGPKTLLRLGNTVINITGIIIGIEASLIVVPPSMFIIEVFRRLAPPKKKSSSTCNEDTAGVEDYQNSLKPNDEKKDKKPFMFPYIFKYIAYVVVFLSSFGSALFTFFYSMMWGPKKSNQWLGSMFAGFFQSVFIIQPIKAAFMAVLLALILRKPVQQDHTGADIDEENKLDKDGDGVVEADEVPVVMPSESVIQRARKIKLKEKMTGKVVKDIFTYTVFLLVVCVLAYSEKDANAYWFRQDLENMFNRGKYTESQPLYNAFNPAVFYLWLRDTLIPNIHVGPWYNDELPKSFKFVENREDLLISIPRLRQQRVKSDTCKVPGNVVSIMNHCETFYSAAVEDTNNYDVGWVANNHTGRSKRDTSWVVDKSTSKRERRYRRAAESSYQAMAVGRGATLRRRGAPKQTSKGTIIFYVDPAALLPDGSVISCSKRWIHYTMTELRGFPVFGKFATYHGSGYVATLGYNEETGWTVIADLHAHSWIDNRTRAVFVEFTVYNANVNLFATAFLFMEILPTGAGVPSSDFKIFNGYRYALTENLGSRLLEVLFLAFVVYFTILEFRKIYKQRCAYVKGFFNIIEIVLIPLYVAMFGLIILRWLSTAENIKTFHENPKDFVSFQYSAEADAMLQGVIGIVAFLLNIKFLKYFQFAKTFYAVGLIMKSFFYPLMGFMIPFSIYFIMFAGAANLGFGSQSKHYNTFLRTCVTQFLHLLGATDFEEARRSGGFIFGPMYYCAYSMFVMIISFNVLMAIICGAIDEDFEEEFEKNLGDIDMMEYIMKKFKRIAGFDDNYENEFEADDQFSHITQDYDAMDRKMKALEDSIEVFSRRIEKLEMSQDSDDLLEKYLKKMKSDNEELEVISIVSVFSM